MARFSTNQILGRIATYGDRLLGNSARSAKVQADVLKNAKNLTPKGVPQSTITRAERVSKVQSGRSFQTRLKTGLGVAAASSVGFLGLHKYHQHKDNKILARIDKMYESD